MLVQCHGSLFTIAPCPEDDRLLFLSGPAVHIESKDLQGKNNQSGSFFVLLLWETKMAKPAITARIDTIAPAIKVKGL